jgi:hypothetical protein
MPVEDHPGAVTTDFRAVRDFLRDGTLSEHGKTISAIAEMVRARISQYVASGAQFKTAGAILRAIETGKPSDILHPDNKASRAVFTELTGVKLPAGVTATRLLFRGQPFAYKLGGKTIAPAAATVESAPSVPERVEAKPASTPETMPKEADSRFPPSKYKVGDRVVLNFPRLAIPA